MKFLAKGISILVLILISFHGLKASDLSGGTGDEFGWELITESFGIKVYERWIETESDVKVRERSGKMILHTSIEEVLSLISDVSKLSLWMNNVENAEILKSISEREWYQRTVLDAPWPFKKQDMVSKYIVEHSPSSKIAKVSILKENKIYPEQDGVQRLDSFNAQWEIEQLSDNKVKVTFTTMSTKPPEYPCWVQDPVVRNMFFSNLKNFKKLISKA